MTKNPNKNKGENSAGSSLASRHLGLGWWFVAIYLSMGIALEVMHAAKVDWYLNVANETRRLMFTLAHSHGALIGILHLAFAFTLSRVASEGAWARRAGACLTGAAILLPGGFFLGGMVVYGGDPGRGVLLVPVGAALLLIAVITTARNARRN